MHTLGNNHAIETVPDNIKQYHLPTIEMAQEYIIQHFNENISLQQLATHCHISAFHFSRLFRMIMKMSPHKYLLSIRLQHAKALIATSEKPVGDIVFECGFNSFEHFVTAYKQQFKLSPTQYRSQLV